MSKWFLIMFALVFLSSIVIIFIRIEGKKENERIKKGDLSAGDFEILEE